MATSWTRSDGLTNINQDYTFHQRIATVKAGLAMFAAHPIVGVGINCALVAFPLYAPPEFKALGSKGALVIHSTIVAGAQRNQGILGGSFPSCSLIICATVSYARQISLSEGLQPLGRRLAVGLEISLWGAMICGLSGGFVLSWFPYLVIGLIASARQIASVTPSE